MTLNALPPANLTAAESLHFALAALGGVVSKNLVVTPVLSVLRHGLPSECR